jgi:hypothetical protein
MFGRIRRALTFANVCSFIALTVALGTGGAYAADTVFSTDIKDGEVKTVDLGDAAVTYEKLGANSIGNAKIKPSAVTLSDVHPDAIDGSKIIDGAIAHADIANDSVNSANVVNESLTASDLATNSVAATEVADDSIDSGEISNESLLASDLAGSSVGASELQDGAVANADLAANAVTASKVTNNTLTTADIAGADVNGGGVSVPPGYVPDGRCRQLDANVGGAKAGEAVIFNVKSPLQDGVVIYGQRVPSDGHVMFDVCNFSGTTQVAISDIPVRVITFG